MNNYENAVLVSYAWGGESERTVDELERAFVAHGICIVRDKKDLEYKSSIDAFEQRIGQGQCIILVISDKYLRSEHCMYELVEADKNQNLRDRIFPIVLADAQIYKAIDRLNYIEYWDEQIKQLNQAIKKIKVIANLSGITADLDKYTRIRASFDHLTDLLSDMNALTPEIHAASGFSTLIGAIEHMMQMRGKTKQVESILEADNGPEQLPSNTKIVGNQTKQKINRAAISPVKAEPQIPMQTPSAGAGNLFDKLRGWLDGLLDNEFRSMIYSLLSVAEQNQLSLPVRQIDRSTFLGDMQSLGRLEQVEAYLLKKYSDRLRK
ncbi:MAG: toll/interleukin-1 receptor domain-containing protein [Anaerolineales bacterium]|nr:toll/interleukin-1 receptor domain-containing protein [Anaerolineales bacterium]